MFGFIKNLFGTAPKAETTEVPYKVETPVVDHADIAVAQRPAPVAEAPKAEAPKAEAPKAEAPKAPAKAKAPAKPKTSPASKKPRAPRKPKK